MKKMLSTLVVILVLGYATSAKAQERPQFTVGLKTWIAIWDETIAGGFDDQSDVGVMAGPAFGARSGDFFVGVTWLTGTFNFEDQPISPGVHAELEWERTDLDMILGYNFHPRIGGFVGYKHIDVQQTTTVVDTTGVSAPIISESDFNAFGPGFGVNFNYPLEGTRFFFTGSLSYLFLELDSENRPTEDFPGFSFDVSGAYIFEGLPASATAGYKIQTAKTDDSRVKEEFSGLTFGVSYSF